MSRNSQSISYINRKIAVMGSPYVGKSTVVYRFVYGEFVEKYESTIEDQLTKRMEFNNRHVSLKVTDTAGQEEYSVFPRSCSFDISGFILMYSIDDRRSFDMLSYIYDKIVDTYGDTSIPLVIVGNKSDLCVNRSVEKREGQELARFWGAQFVEISAKNVDQVSALFELILREIEISRGNIVRSPPKNPQIINNSSQNSPNNNQNQINNNNNQNQNDKDSCTIC
ncbi:unnamed protein product [Caenorhabditis angaria]|uniref:Uncharacterized protein n=1 Tax=Caenorhabditis angaria TaxID=860376 RepID=A0A9P1IFY3_9PELO|nr:unnamed protein product [Caenorhabditis angaria]